MSFKSLVKSTIVLGSTSAATALISIMRVKVLALMVGPAGLGLLGALAGLASAGTTVAAVGSDTSGTRRIALHRDDPAALARTRRLLALIALVHGLLGATAIWILRADLCRWLLGSPEHQTAVGLAGIAVALSLLAGLNIAQLQGLGRVGDIAHINIQSSLAGTILGLFAVWQIGAAGLVVLVVAQPLMAAILAVSRTRCLPAASQRQAFSAGDFARDWATTIVHGAPYMLSYLMLALVPLAIRALVVHQLGIEAAGHFHAAWTMSVMYVGFLLNAMSADYFPRLTALANDEATAHRLVNDQVKLGLAIGAPALLGVMAFAPLLVPLLYSRAFTPAVEIVELQALGNLMKIVGWPIAFIAMARGRSMQFFALEATWSAAFLLMVWFGLPATGLAATGTAFAVACGLFLALQLAAAYLAYGFTLQRTSVALLLLVLAAGLLTLGAAHYSLTLQITVGTALTAASALLSLRYILTRLDREIRPIAALRARLARLGWPASRASQPQSP